MKEFEGKDIIVVGNGSSLRQVQHSDIDADALIIRINNFFFEDVLYVGPRVDIAYVGGDRWFFPLYLATLKTVMKHDDYRVAYVAARQKHVLARLQRNFPDTTVGFWYSNKSVETAVKTLRDRYGRGPSAGIQAVLLAHALGARSITLMGFDFHLDNGYAYQVNKTVRLAAGGSLISNYRKSHNERLDMDIIRWLHEHGGVAMYRHWACERLDFLPVQQSPLKSLNSTHAKTLHLTKWVGSGSGSVRFRSWASRVDRRIRRIIRPL